MSESLLQNYKFELAIIDDHDGVLLGISTCIKKTFVNANIKTFIKGADFLSHLSNRKVDICIVDLELPDIQGIKIIETIKKQRPDTKIIVYTVHDEPWVLNEVMAYNVDGIVLKSSLNDMLKRAVEEVLNGGKFYCQKMKERKQEHKEGTGGAFILWETFNPHYKQIVILIAKSYKYHQIAVETGLAEHTVKSYKKNIFRIFQVKSAPELIAKAIAYGFIDKKDLL